MTAKEYINSLFSEYEENTATNDFKEELLSNLESHISSLKAKGLSDSDAFYKATNELGDITTIANQISLKRKCEVYETMYMKTTRSYISPMRRIAYITALGIFLFGVIVTLTMFPELGLSSMIPFGIFPVSWVTYLLLTQETARLNPMKKIRAIIYSTSVAILVFGLIIFSTFYTGHMGNWTAAQSFGVLIPFGIPQILILAYLTLTEQDRTKSWVTANNQKIQ